MRRILFVLPRVAHGRDCTCAPSRAQGYPGGGVRCRSARQRRPGRSQPARNSVRARRTSSRTRRPPKAYAAGHEEHAKGARTGRDRSPRQRIRTRKPRRMAKIGRHLRQRRWINSPRCLRNKDDMVRCLEQDRLHSSALGRLSRIHRRLQPCAGAEAGSARSDSSIAARPIMGDRSPGRSQGRVHGPVHPRAAARGSIDGRRCRSGCESHRAAANGMRAADIDAFDKWLQERDGIAKQTASASAAIPQWRARRRLSRASEGFGAARRLARAAQRRLFELR